MLNRTQKPIARAKNNRRQQKKWHDENANASSIGCSICPEFSICGGLKVSRSLYWCLDYCCGNVNSCDVVCRNSTKFVDQVREIGGFDLKNTPRAPLQSNPKIPIVAPLLFHGNSRNGRLQTAAVTLPFARMFDRRTGHVRFESRARLCEEFKIDELTTILLSGTDSDPPIENWWHLGRERRSKVVRALARCGVAITTSPNYSLFIDQPRWDDLHSMKRIAIVHSEMLNEGLQVALHVNGRTETDFLRWAEYIQSRSEIMVLAYEFATGTGWIGRRLHLTWLAGLARKVGRPLDLIVRGGIELLPSLNDIFSRVTFIDTAAFMRTMKRRRALVTESGRLHWRPSPTELGAPLDELLNANVVTVTTWIRSQLEPVQMKRKTA